jgi:hypothetical protein
MPPGGDHLVAAAQPVDHLLCSFAFFCCGRIRKK